MSDGGSLPGSTILILTSSYYIVLLSYSNNRHMVHDMVVQHITFLTRNSKITDLDKVVHHIIYRVSTRTEADMFIQVYYFSYISSTHVYGC